MILFSATKKGDVNRVRGLIEMGRKLVSMSTIPFNEKTFTDVTALHMAIFQKRPNILACLLQARNIDETINIKCKEGIHNEYSPLQLAVKITTGDGDTYARMVCVSWFYLTCTL